MDHDLLQSLPEQQPEDAATPLMSTNPPTEADPLERLTQAAADKAVPKPPAQSKQSPHPAAQRVAAKTAVNKAAAEQADQQTAESLATMRAELQAEMDRKFAVNNAIRDEAIRLQMDPEHVAFFAACETPEDVQAIAGLLQNYLSKTVEIVRSGMLQQMRDEGYTLVKNGQASTPNGAAPALPADPFAPLPPLQFQLPNRAPASKPGTTPARPTSFAEAAAMIARGQNIA